jgi:hypothetical protein
LLRGVDRPSLADRATIRVGGRVLPVVPPAQLPGRGFVPPVPAARMPVPPADPFGPGGQANQRTIEIVDRAIARMQDELSRTADPRRRDAIMDQLRRIEAFRMQLPFLPPR